MRLKFWDKAQKEPSIDRNQEAADHFRAQAALEPATTKEYADWVEAYLKKGDKITGFGDRNMGGDDVLIARQEAILPDLSYPIAFRFIVPNGVDIGTLFPSAGMN